jgi:hypothetical protein
VLGELPVAAAKDLAILVNDERGGAGRALVQGENAGQAD